MAGLETEIWRRSLKITSQDFIDLLSQVEFVNVRIAFILVFNHGMESILRLNQLSFTHIVVIRSRSFVADQLFRLLVNMLPLDKFKFLAVWLLNNSNNFDFVWLQSLQV